ncbi:MAG: N-acetylneuraminate synthase family protein [Desulfarculales bacterium]|jgi:N-acetylneuraminate synthase|nr:N-acetylneuraminate synthase family protein [Desulfarculales bacterium]
MKENEFDNLFIFEMANNHQGDINHALAIIEVYESLAKKYKINAAIKLQYRNLPEFIHPDYRNKTDIPHVERFMSTMLSAEDFHKMVNAIKACRMLVMCTPFDEASVDLCIDHDIDILKVASCSALDWPLHEKIASAGKPVIVSTGGLSLASIDKVYNFYTHRYVNFALLHCVALYPLPHDIAQMNFLDRMKKRYPDITIGYSGHEAPTEFDVVKIAVAKGAKIFERHIGLPTDSITLNGYSMNPHEAEEWIKAIQKTWEICGGAKVYASKEILQKEKDSLDSLGRGVFARENIKKGELLSGMNTFFAMPLLSDQLSSGAFKPWMTADKDYTVNAPIAFQIPGGGDSSVFRSVVHEAKGMLMEYQIALNNNTEFEFSHHYGRKHFREWGAIIVNVVNREYCKKIIIVLPKQQHPSHHHKKKEESFQVLAGELKLVMNDEKFLLQPGDFITVPRGVKHAFSSELGAIFEEISTTHVKDDSFYEDKDITTMDIVDRKTILKSW